MLLIMLEIVMSDYMITYVIDFTTDYDNMSISLSSKIKIIFIDTYQVWRMIMIIYWYSIRPKEDYDDILIPDKADGWL